MRILIVEDDPMVRKVSRGFVKKIKSTHVVFEAATLDEAKERLVKESIDLVLLDVYLDDDYGPDLLDWIRQEQRDVDVILITADNSAQTVEKAFRLGSVDYLIKPFQFHRFKEAIEKVDSRKNQLDQHSALEQSHIDRMIGGQQNVDNRTLGKGISPSTYDRIEEALRGSTEPLSAVEIAERTQLARVTVRRYLEYMVEQHRATEHLAYGKVGRPKKFYTVAEKDVD